MFIYFYCSDRTTPIGKMLDKYLKQSHEMDDNAVHLLFSANRYDFVFSCCNIQITVYY